ncbi:glycosyltransferase [Marinibacterium sp. SX1]|uniref:glycosyltransferase n=1 Tax=Marinibacterium sp. SX1 TaxID=3388424 RepID=UPI003D1868CF
MKPEDISSSLDVHLDFNSLSSTCEHSRIATILVHRRLDDPESGSGVYLLGLIDQLARAGFEIRIILAPVTAFGSRPISRPAAIFRKKTHKILWPDSLRIGSWFVSTRAAVWKRAIRRGLALAHWRILRPRSPRPSFPSCLGSPLGPAEIAQLAGAANAGTSALVVAEYSSLAPVLAHCHQGKRAVLLHDLFSLRADSFASAGLAPDHTAVSFETEIGWLQNADTCIYASASEARRLSPHLPGKRHIWLPPQVRLRKVRPGGKPYAVFLGVRHAGNTDALNMLLNDVWPTVRRRLPDAELWIAGEISDDVRDAPEGVRLLGRIKDLSDIGGADAVGLAPARAASGISIKIATYFELGMSVLATPKALDGYDGRLDGLLVQASDAADFSNKLVSLLSDPCLREASARRGYEEITRRIGDTGLETYLQSLIGAAQTIA